MTIWGVVLLIYVAITLLSIGFAVGLFWASAMAAGHQADAQVERQARDRAFVREAFQCAVAQVAPIRGYHDTPAEDRTRVQLLNHMWTHHGGIAVIGPKQSS